MKAVRLFLMTASEGSFGQKKKKGIILYKSKISRTNIREENTKGREAERGAGWSQSPHVLLSLGVKTTVALRISFIQKPP